MVLEEVRVDSAWFSDLCPECRYENLGKAPKTFARLSQLSNNPVTVEFACYHCGHCWSETTVIDIACRLKG